MDSHTFDKLSFLVLFLVVILLPIFFLPFTNFPIEISKGLLLVVGLALCVIFWAIARFFDGEIILPKSLSLLAGLGIVMVFFLSATFSGSSAVSFFGTMFDVGTFWFMFVGFLLMMMCAIIFRDARDAKIILFGAVLSSAVVLIFQALRLFFGGALSFGVLGDTTHNLIGSWNAFGIFAGLSALISLLVVEFFPTTRVEKLLLQGLTLLSLLLIAAVNFSFVWSLLGVFALIIFVYKLSLTSNNIDSEGKRHHFPVFSFVVILVTLLFFISGQFIGSILPNYFKLTNIEVSPSLSSTVDVSISALKVDPFLGIGPNRFSVAWSMYKPVEINSTAFFDTSFGSGSGLLPTFMTTVGSLGVLVWLVFFIALIWGGVKSIFSSIRNGDNWETMAFFVLSFYLFVSSFFYSTGAVLFLLALAFAGVFIGLSSSSAPKGQISLAFLNDHRKSFFSILTLVLIIIISVGISFKYIERFVSVSYFRQALTAPDIETAEKSIGKALSLYTNDLYLRTYSQIYLLKLNSIVTKESLSEEEKASIQTNLDQAVNGAQMATTFDSKNYSNFQSLGAVYQNLGAIGIKDTYPKAIEAYKTASTLNPKSPSLKLFMASVAFADGKNKEAKDYAKEALALKPDFVDAWLLLSQIAIKEGDKVEALSYAEAALSILPTNKELISYVNSLKGSSANISVPTIKEEIPKDTTKKSIGN